jgi:hypothetical protein
MPAHTIGMIATRKMVKRAKVIRDLGSFVDKFVRLRA